MSPITQVVKSDLIKWSRVLLCIALLCYSSSICVEAGPRSGGPSTELAPAATINPKTITFSVAGARSPKQTGSSGEHQASDSSSGAAPAASHASDMMMEMPLVAPFFLEDEQISSVITMVNEVDEPVNASIELFAQDGAAILTHRVHFGPHTQRVVRIADLLANLPEEPELFTRTGLMRLHCPMMVPIF